MNVLIAGGGTGGHLFPGIAVAQEMQRRHPSGRILFVGSPRGIETKAVPKAGFELALLSISGLRRMGAFGFVRGLFRVPWALWQAMLLVRRFRPDVAVSVGGYAAGPAVLAASLLRVPCVVMEQNTVAGFTNKVLARFAKKVITPLPSNSFASEKTLVLGNPVRADLLAVREQSYAPAVPLRLLVFGGSQGAQALNQAMIDAAPLLAKLASPPRIVHQTGVAQLARVQEAYAAAGLSTASVHPFIENMAEAFSAADLVICRAGATTVAELTVCGRPAVFVPLPTAVDDHQTQNAKVLVEAGAALLVPQKELTAQTLVSLIEELQNERERLVEMARKAHELGRPEAASAIADALEQVVQHV